MRDSKKQKCPVKRERENLKHSRSDDLARIRGLSLEFNPPWQALGEKIEEGTMNSGDMKDLSQHTEEEISTSRGSYDLIVYWKKKFDELLSEIEIIIKEYKKDPCRQTFAKLDDRLRLARECCEKYDMIFH